MALAMCICTADAAQAQGGVRTGSPTRVAGGVRPRAATSTLPQVATPQFSLAPGTYSSAQGVSITDATPAATIYYTVDGTLPSTNSAVYSSAITVSTSTVITAIATAPGYTQSYEMLAGYFISTTPSSFVYTLAGNGTPGYSGDGGGATIAQLNWPEGTALDSAGNLYISDSDNNIIRKVAANTGIISTIAGNGVAAHDGDGDLQALRSYGIRGRSRLTVAATSMLPRLETMRSVELMAEQARSAPLLQTPTT